MSSPTEINRVDFLCKKRKMLAEPVGVPRPKHVRWSQVLEYIDPSSESDPIVDPKKMGGEYIRHSNLDSTMLTCNEDKTDPGYSNTRASNELPGSSFSGSIECRSVTKPTSSESETLSDHEAELLGFGSLSEFGYRGYDYKELEYLLLSSGIDPSDYILSSGDQDGGKKLTIDEEFEECFSMLML